MLRRDHRRIERLIDEVEQTSDDARQSREDAFRRLRDELDFHSRAEESVVYSRLKNVAPTHERVLDSIEEHHVVTLLLGELDAMPNDHERWIAKLRVLRDAVRRHIEEEEQRLYADLERLLDEEQIRKLGGEMTRQKDAWMELERRSPTAAGMVRGMTQVAERLPFGSGAIIASVQSHPERVNRIVSRLQSVVPNRRRGMFGFMYRMTTLPIRVPLALVSSR